MARQATTQPVDVKVDAGIPAGHALTIAEEKRLHTIENAATAHRDALHRAGRAQTHLLYHRLSRVGLLAEFEQARESKDFIGLPYIDRSDGTEKSTTCRTFDEYCTYFLGLSYNTLAEWSQRKAELGAEAYESACAFRISAQQLRQISKLPEDEKEVIKAALREKDRDKLLDLVEAIVVKHAKERAQLEEKIAKADDEHRKVCEAKDSVIGQTTAKSNELAEKLARREAAPESEQEARTNEEIWEAARAGATACTGLEKLFRSITAETMPPKIVQVQMEHAVHYLMQRLVDLANDFQIGGEVWEIVSPPWDEHAKAALNDYFEKKIAAAEAHENLLERADHAIESQRRSKRERTIAKKNGVRGNGAKPETH